ncbi:MAG: glutaredoxin family protein [Aggregatilineales bacterium]
MDKELVMYTRTSGCPFVTLAKRVLIAHDVPYREIFIDQDMTARERVLKWTGFLAVPTLVIANFGEDLPYAEPDFLPAGDTPRGIDRGAMLTEPGMDKLKEWLQGHGFIAHDIEDSTVNQSVSAD